MSIRKSTLLCGVVNKYKLENTKTRNIRDSKQKMVSSEEETEVKPYEPVQWDVEMEIQLFYAMANYKPVGINKHFHMAGIWEKLTDSIPKPVSTHDIWKHLETLYDLNMLEDTEPIPFPNHEIPFSLPESEFGALIKQKCKEAILGDESEDGRSPSPKPSTPNRSASRGTASKDNTPKAGGRKDSVSALATKSRKESGSSHASTDTPSVKSDKEYDRRRDSRDSNASGPRDGQSSSRKSTTSRDKSTKAKAVESPLLEDEVVRRGRRRPNTSTPPTTVPAKRRRT